MKTDLTLRAIDAGARAGALQSAADDCRRAAREHPHAAKGLMAASKSYADLAQASRAEASELLGAMAARANRIRSRLQVD